MLACVTLSGTLAMHLLVPALPAAARALGVAPSTAALMITFYVVGLAIGQLVHGPLADAFGRRPTLLAGLAVYTVAGVVAALATRIEILLAARLLQAAGGCAGLLLSRAIVRDTSETRDAIARLGLLSTMTVMGPALAPLIGGVVASLWGWRSLLVVLAALGLLNLLLVWRQVPETGTPSGRLSPAGVLADYASLLRSPVFSSYAAAGAVSSTCFYAFIAAAPFIYSVQLHRPLAQVGAYVTVTMLGAALGGTLASRLARTWAPERILLRGNALASASVCLLLVLALTAHLSVAAVTGCMFIFAVSSGACNPAIAIKVLSVDRQRVGSASGLFGATQMGVGALSTILATAGPNPAVLSAAVMATCGLLAQLLYRKAIRIERG